MRASRRGACGAGAQGSQRTGVRNGHSSENLPAAAGRDVRGHARGAVIVDAASAVDEERAVRDAAASAAGVVPGARLLQKFPYVPLAFLGLALYRAWIELVYVGSPVDFPFIASSVHNLYDACMIALLFVLAALHRKVEPLYTKPWVYALGALLMVGGTVATFATMVVPDVRLAAAGAAAGGAGTAFIILLWSELYASLDPFRVGLYYCASMIAAAFIIYFCHGLLLPWAAGTAVLLPLGSLLFVVLGFMSLPASERPRASAARFSFPWKPVFLMAIYAFAFGLREESQYSTGFGPHSAFGTLAMALFLFVVIYRQSSDFKFGTIYRVGLPLMMGAFLVIPAFGGLNAQVANFCAMGSYTAFSLLIMLIMAHMSYRYGMSAVWLFGIERGVRALFSMVGRGTSIGIQLVSGDATAELVLGAITVLAVAVGTMLFVTEKDFLGRWGVAFKDETKTAAEVARLRAEDVELRCDEMARQFDLSPREREVLGLLAQKRTVGQIARGLTISNDTAKTHVKHIYRKMDVHSRKELLDVLGVTEEDGAPVLERR